MIKENIINYGYHHLEPGHPDNQKNYRVCGSQTRQSESRPVCHRPAGWGTSHPGVGRCKLHGGCSPSGPDHPNWRGGRYAHKFRGRLKQHYEDLGMADDNPLDLMPELEVQRTILSMALLALNEKASRYDSTNDISESVDAQTSLEMVGDGGVGGLTRKGYLVDNPDAEFLSVNQDIHLVSELVNDVVSTVAKIHTIHNRNSLTKTEVNYLMSKIKQGLDKFVPVENREAFIRWLVNEIPNDDDRASS